MTNRLELNWKVDGFVDEQRYYCSETAIDVENLPAPKAILSRDVRAYVDTDGVLGKKYYVRISTVKNDVEKVSDERVVLFGKAWTPLDMGIPPKSFIASNSVVADSSNRVEKITDQSGNGYDFVQTNNTYKPTLLSSQIKFDGVNDYLSINTGQTDIYMNQSRCYLFFVVESLIAGTLIRPLFITIDNTATRIGLHQINATQMRFSLRSRDSDALQSILFNYSTNERMIIMCQADLSAKTMQVFKNGVSIGSIALTTSQTAFANSTPSLYPQIGSGGGGVTPWSGNLMSFVTGINTVATDERQKLEGWAAHKYNLADSLASNHPYKILVPTI